MRIQTQSSFSGNKTPLATSEPTVAFPSMGAGPEARLIDEGLKIWSGVAAPQLTEGRTLESAAFALKEQVSTVAMHLTPEWRSGLFRQIDQMLSPEDWEQGEPLPYVGSWRTLIRLVTYLRFRERPGLNFYQGNAVLSWSREDIRLTVECLGDDNIRLVGSRRINGVTEASASDTTIQRLTQFLVPYDAVDWLFDGAGRST